MSYMEKNNINNLKKYNINDLDNYKNDYENSIKLIDDMILKNYLSKLEELDIVRLDETNLENNFQRRIRFFKVSKLVYEKNEFAVHKFVNIFSSLSNAKSSILLFMDSDGKKLDLYIGVRIKGERTAFSAKETIENALKGQFPGTQTIQVKNDDIKNILDNFDASSISISTCIAGSKNLENNNESFIQGLEKFILSMQGEAFKTIIIANRITQQEINDIKQQYESISSNLSPFSKIQVNYNNNITANISQTNTKGTSTSNTVGYSESSTFSKTENTSTSISTSEGTSEPTTSSRLIAAATACGTLVGGAIGGPMGALAANACGNLINTTLGSKTKNSSRSEQTQFGESYTESNQKGTNHSNTISENKSISNSQGLSNGTSQSLTLNIEDKKLLKIIEKIDKHLERIECSESFGMYECAAYFISEDNYTAERAASTYNSLMKGENSGIEISAINTWFINSDRFKVRQIQNYIKNFIHPVFKYSFNKNNILVTPATLVSGKELSIHMGLPRKSVNGLPVIEQIPFGMEVVKYDKLNNEDDINIGKIFNMGEIHKENVFINKNSLTMHTFITGSTGSGKSNTVYTLLKKLKKENIKFMVIEPAKGEYKNIFGHYEDVKVLGTNPNITEVLKINPFKFPKEIHIFEHIDKLVEIFNVCWPMYAAMPAILKDAVLNCYEKCGWNLKKSTNKNGDIYPTFKDLLVSLENVINATEYSQELKSNYIGSLVTRVRSLVNGLNGQIFNSNEIDNTILFDTNVIIDLSRISSFETKSLIMGILIMKLNEYRMSNSTGMNEDLKHITVLEEAHNILKRVCQEQNSESSNIGGKSVEIISNSIAEMRTYGEGFIIVDQSPMAVDISAIRNTNTKIIMRLPDEDDRRIAGKSASLKNEQLDELSKLPNGVAAIYQNDWLEPVLCKVDFFETKEVNYICPEYLEEEKEIENYTVNLILNKLSENNIEKFKEKIKNINILDNNKQTLINCINDRNNIESLSRLAYNFFNGKELFRKYSYLKDYNEWLVSIYSEIDLKVNYLSDIEKEKITLLLFMEEKNIRNDNIENITEYLEKFDCSKF